MEKTRKILTLLTILVMALCMTTTVFAAGETGTITIGNAIVDQTYNAYRIFDLSFSPATEEGGVAAYSYTVNSAWTNFINSADIKDKYVSIDNAGYVTWVEDADAAEFAKLALAYAKTNSIAATATQKATAETVTMADLPLGYYLVDSTVGTLCALDTTDTEVTITDKNDEPTIENYVKADSGDWAETNTETIGKDVEHKIVINAKEGAEGYVLENVYSEGLTYKEVTSVTLDGTEVSKDDYTVEKTENGFKITFDQEFLDTLKDTSKIEVFHTATLNKDAEIHAGENTSEAKLSYGEKSDIKVAVDNPVITYTYEFDLVKTDSSKKVLDGATFKLYDAETAGNEIKVVAVEGQTGVYRVALEGETGVVESIPAGQATIQGLGNGTYYLEEVAAPEGYNELTARQSVTIASTNNKATVADGTYDNGGVQVINKTGTELPTTGGMGTTILYIIGGTLMVAAGVTIVARKKMANQK